MHLFYSNVKLKVLFIFPIHVSSFSQKHKFTSPNLEPKAASKATLNAKSLYLDAYYVVAQLQSQQRGIISFTKMPNVSHVTHVNFFKCT